MTIIEPSVPFFSVVTKHYAYPRSGSDEGSAQARKQWPGLPLQIKARLLSKKIKGKVVSVLTSMTDPLRFLVASLNVTNPQ